MLTERLERHQVAIYLTAIGTGVLVGLTVPGTTALEHAINPVLAALLYVTFLQVPVAELGRSLRAGRFVGAVLVTNFIVVPLVVAAIFPFLPDNQAIRVGVLLVLLCPCIDYVIVFTGLADGDGGRLLAVTPLLLIAQLILLPGYLALFFGRDLPNIVDVSPFLRAFVFLIVIPLALAWLTQAWSARSARGREFRRSADAGMVPLMAATLFVVVASQVTKLDGELSSIAPVLPFYALFLVVMVALGALIARGFRLDVGAARAVAFSGATRNSLVVLPLALALPAGFELAAAVVVAQTLVEVAGMVVCVRAVPRLIS